MPATFGADLIFKLDRACPGTLQRTHRMPNVERVAKPGIGIDNDRQLRRIADRRRVLGNFRQADEPQIGHPEIGIAQPGAGKINGLKALIGNHPRSKGIGRPRHEQRPARLQAGAKGLVDFMIQHKQDNPKQPAPCRARETAPADKAIGRTDRRLPLCQPEEGLSTSAGMLRSAIRVITPT